MNSNRFHWGEDSYKSRGALERAIAEYLVNELDAHKFGTIHTKASTYHIRIKATLVKQPKAKKKS